MIARSWFRCLVVIPAAAVVLNLAARAEPVVPDDAAAREFAIGLARDYLERGTEAVLNRTDDDAIRELIFGPANAASPLARSLWEHDLVHSLPAEVRDLRDYPIPVTARVMLLDDARWLECQFLSKTGMPELARFRLVKSRIGTVRISDVLMAGDGVSFTERVRQIYLLERVAIGDVAEAEIPLWAAGENYGPQVLEALKLYARGSADEAFGIFANLPADVRETAVWRYYRNSMAFYGCKAARANLDKDVRAGGDVDPFVRFRLAVAANATSAALPALDDILRDYDEPLLYRCAKANLLLTMGHPDEAYALASDVIELMPASGFVYLIAVKAAAAAHKPASAVSILKRWALLAPLAQIDKTLRADPSIPAAFFTSTEYLAWFNLSPTPAHLLPR